MSKKTYIFKIIRLGGETHDNVSCRRASGLPWDIGENVHLYRMKTVNDMISQYAIIYGSDVEKNLVKTNDANKLVNVTKLSSLWFIVPVIKFFYPY